MKLVWDKAPSENNGRNSEGSFIRLPDNGIMFAYSRYRTASGHDNADCDIAAVYSYDEGESWSEPEIIIRAEQFGVGNIMSVSALYGKRNEIMLFFLIKENEGNISLGRGISKDGKVFDSIRCKTGLSKSYYVVNNDRVIRLSDGRIAAPAAMHAFADYHRFGVSVLLVSEDEGVTFTAMPPRLTVPALDESTGAGMQEPGIIEHRDGTVRLWARTKLGSQYECFSRDGLKSFSYPAPSAFTSPDSPLEMAENNGVLYAVYNPVPRDGYSDKPPVSWGRTPLVMRKSFDDGRTWERAAVIEADENRGYCYPAMFFTNDGCILLAYCRGGAEDGTCLNRLGIAKIEEDLQKNEL